VAARIGLMEVLSILFVVGTSALILGTIVFIVKYLRKKQTNFESRLCRLEENIDDSKNNFKVKG